VARLGIFIVAGPANAVGFDWRLSVPLSCLFACQVQPYENPSTNALSSFAQLQLLSTYLLAYALVIELKSAPESKLVFIGTLLLLANLSTLFVALYLQITEGDRHVELTLTLAESEMREAELVHEAKQMKAE
jgi:hypothetical protein